jgi:uncharacterized protein (TIGR00369 family)
VTSSAVPARRSPEEQARLEAGLRDIFEHHFHFHALIGLRIESFKPDAPGLAFDMRQELMGSGLHRRLHGGVIATALDTVGGLAVTMAIAEKHSGETAEQVMARFERIGTVDLRVDYLQQGTGRRFHAQGRVMRLGSRLASAQMELTNEEARLIATGSAVYVVS